MLFIPFVDKKSTQREFVEAETLLVLVITPSKISLFFTVQIFQQMNLGMDNQSLRKSEFLLNEP